MDTISTYSIGGHRLRCTRNGQGAEIKDDSDDDMVNFPGGMSKTLDG